MVRLVRLASTPRRAQNLSERYRKLETARPKQVPQPQPNVLTPLDTIAGFLIPKVPRAPADDECCMSGCAVCVYDVYEEAVTAYKRSVATLCAALSARDIPETEWPVHIRTGKYDARTTTKDVVLNAFEEMERALKERRKAD